MVSLISLRSYWLLKIFIISTLPLTEMAMAVDSSPHALHMQKSPSSSKSKTKASKIEHSHSTGFSYNLGLSATKSLSNEHEDTMNGMAMPMMKGMKMPGDAEGGDAKVDSMAMLMASYQFNPYFSLDVMGGQSTKHGTMDPTIGSTYYLPISKIWKSATVLNFMIPVSQMSRESFLQTSVSLSSGLSASVKRRTFFAAIDGSMSWYKKTLFDPNAQDAGHDAAAHLAPGHGTSEMSPEMMMGMREFNRIGATTGLFYNLRPKVQLKSSIGLKQIQYQDASPDWQTHSTLIRATYASDGFMPMGYSSMPVGYAVEGTLELVKTAESLSLPSIPQVIFGISYGGI